MLKSTSSLITNIPVLIFILLEVSLSAPLNLVGPGLTSSPVTDEIFISGVNQDIVISLEEISDLWGEIEHPVSKESGVDNLVALSPGSSLNSKDIKDVIFGQEVIRWGHIIAKWWLITSFSDVINVELWLEWISENDLDVELTELHSSKPNSSLDDGLASFESSSENILLDSTNELVLVSEGIVSWVLEIWVNKTISNSHTLEVGLQVVLVLESKVVRDSWDVMTSVRLTSDEEVFTLELWVKFQKLDQELGHVVTNLILVCNKMSWISMRESSSNRLINIDEVCISIP